MINDERYDLFEIISNDLIRYGKLPVIILFAVLVSSVLIVVTTYQTRRITFEREQIMLKQNMLDIEWRNLILEENALGDHIRVERIAIERLNMKYIDPSQENIVVFHQHKKIMNDK